MFSLARDWSKRVMWAKLTVFLELRSRKTLRFSEQITSADKYPSIFSRQMKAIVYIYIPPRICLDFKLVPIQYREYQYGLLPWTARVITYWLRFIFAVHFGIQFKTRRRSNAPNDRFAICSVISSLSSSSVEIWFFRLVWYLIISMQKLHHADWLRACQLIPNSAKTWNFLSAERRNSCKKLKLKNDWQVQKEVTKRSDWSLIKETHRWPIKSFAFKSSASPGWRNFSLVAWYACVSSA